MATFLLDKKTNLRIEKELLNIEELQKNVMILSPDLISSAFPHDSTIHIAAVCFQDATHTLSETRYALREAFAHQMLYEEKQKPSPETGLIWVRQFYYVDIAFRLYSAGEDLANAIISMMEINEADLKKYQTNKRISKQSIVGNYLKNEMPNHPITKIIKKLAESKQWQDTMTYRHCCVHDQPPAVEGLGIIHTRKKLWETSPDGKTFLLRIGAGDKPRYTIDDIWGFVKPALYLFADILNEIVQFYLEILEKKGIILNSEKGRITSKIIV